ncbi:probable polygalacturonase At1g80170 [Camellia sinensis]|uniref:probable polygalacturonase At1g80170 n=1 Tax=Camellia sinensis TaxID=4442 RepID=UPI0010365DE9|nr:probable polygalacturonase At1g80170 [Camellia sinensis]
MIQLGFAPFGSCCFICQRTRPNYFKSFEDAWKATCSAREVSGFSPTMHVPDGYEFLLQPLIFSGPCNSEAVNVVIDGNLTAPSHPSKWKCDGSNCRQWIGFVEINGLYIYGSGTINAQGTKWWGSSNVNHNGKYHGSKPTGFVIAHSNNVHISDLTFIDSPQMHMALERSIWVYVYNLTITAPGDSPNTDGIHIQHSTHVFISQTHIGTGDDCISIGDGSSYLNISMITCGPGHGISIGSLGIRGQYETVENVYVSNVEFRGTSNGARIKTWQGGSGFARNIVFEHIRSIGSAHPIIIDQYYCDHTHCKNQKSAVQISNIRYSYIYGTSEEDTAIHFACSETVPCKDIYMNDIYLQSTQLCKETTSLCQNVAGRKNGPVLPSVPCLTD